MEAGRRGLAGWTVPSRAVLVNKDAIATARERLMAVTRALEQPRSIATVMQDRAPVTLLLLGPTTNSNSNNVTLNPALLKLWALSTLPRERPR